MDRNGKLTVIMNFLTAILITLLSSGCYRHAEPEMYLIPKDFTGRATVVFNQKNGDSVKYENGRRVYKIPANGICLTQFKPTYGITDRQYFYVDSLGNRTLLPIYIEEHQSDGTIKWIVKDDNTVGIFLDGTTGQYADGEKAPFQEIAVSSLNTLDSFFTPSYKKQFENNLRKLTGLEEISIP